ncbi:glycosyltransferase involved in cell wall biosynthesis [Prosthecobacter fusiformis]|uniref:Glycosyltransferase involved in cell wall biosynthesis n=1 Tax=Prosthecobacter fusiformis TaxID=48464 RepID=A0A4V3FG61_9BACT|nr:glycosyltransferase family 4 protein [Prosthecobacter fusiformis]TDU73403.1 glycosyltransferase involved in cell wall biosynthesis [Prosthecobacter fusiformis]
MASSAQTPAARLLWIDPFFQATRPTTQSLFQALPFVLEKGWPLELWCLDHDPLDARVKVVKLPHARVLRLLEPLWFWFMAWCRLSWLRLCGQSWAVVHTSGPDMAGADVMSLHFHNRTWLRLQWWEQADSFKDRLRILHTLIGVVQETFAFKSGRWRVILPVSEGLANRIRPQLAVGKRIHVLPNALDESRFHSGVRERHRESMRKEMQAQSQDYVFIFVSTGHYHRKGLMPALLTVQACRDMAREELGLNLRFWVVGAGERAQSALIPQLEQTIADWREWVQLVPPTQAVERYYAAADAFLFPSRYETFSLVALEAAACGLPLLVTAYDGHEMYLEDGINGFLMPWDREGMKERVTHFLRSGRHLLRPGPSECIHASGYAECLDRVYGDVIRERIA